MSTALNRNIAGIACLIFAVSIMICIWRMIPYGLAGETGKIKLYFMLMTAAFIFSLASGLLYYYYRSKSEAENTGRIYTEVNTLSRVGRQQEGIQEYTSKQNEHKAS